MDFNSIAHMLKKHATLCLLFAGMLFVVPAARGQQLQTFKDCVVGKRVSTNDGRKGVITRLDAAWSYCYVKFDDNGKEASFLYSLLNAEGGSGIAPATGGQQLQTFKDCVVGKRVSTNDGRKGVITRLDAAWSYCYVKFDDNGKEASFLYSLLNAEGGSGIAPATGGQQLQSFKDCAVGKRVSTNDGRKGVITRLDTAWSYCYVKFDDDGKEASFIYSLLNSEGAPANSGSLALGTYE